MRNKPGDVDFERGVLVGILITAGSFGSDGKQPEVVVKMPIGREKILRWLERQIPGSKVYGPYRDGKVRYYQWMSRGTSLKEFVVPLIWYADIARYDDYQAHRLTRMAEKHWRKLLNV